VSTIWNVPSGRPAWRISCANASAIAGVYSAGFHTTAFPHRSAGTRYQEGHCNGEVAGGDDGGDADGCPEREELLVGHLGGHRHPVEPPPFSEEERTGVHDFLDLRRETP
jgi:hypothetical protein